MGSINKEQLIKFVPHSDTMNGKVFVFFLKKKVQMLRI